MHHQQLQVQDHYSPVICPNHHLLLQAKDLDPYITTDYLTAQYTCKSCRITSLRDDPSHFCVLCKFDLCQECYEIQSKVRIACPVGHILYKINTLKMMNIENRKAYCKKCKTPFDKLSERPTSCFKCKYDLCEGCSSKYQSQVSDRHHLLRYRPAVKNEEKAGHAIGTCWEFHPLVHIEEPGSKVSAMCCFQVKDSYVCIECNYDFDSGSKQVSLYSCKECNFDLCSDCSQLNEALNFSCSRRHKLLILSSLKRFFLSDQDTYTCKCCQKEYQAEVSPSCYCRICCTHLCPQCCASYQLMINWKEQKIEDGLNILKKRKKEDLVCDEDQKEDSFERLKDKEDPDEKLKKKKNPAEKVIEKENYVDEFSKKRIFVEEVNKKEESKEEEKKEWKEEVACIVCLDSARTHVFTPCNHLCACESCSADIIKKKSGCPICRVDIQGTVKIFMS